MANRVTGWAAALLASACAAQTPSVSFDGILYKRVTGEQLKAAIVNKEFVFAEPRTAGGEIFTSPKCDRFFADGRYLTCGDKVPHIVGTYSFAEDAVCATIGPNTRCWRLYVSSRGEYLVEHSSQDGAVPFVRVSIEIIRA